MLVAIQNILRKACHQTWQVKIGMILFCLCKPEVKFECCSSGDIYFILLSCPRIISLAQFVGLKDYQSYSGDYTLNYYESFLADQSAFSNMVSYYTNTNIIFFNNELES